MKTTTSPEVTGPVAIIGGKAHLTPAQVEELTARRFNMKTKHTPGKWAIDSDSDGKLFSIVTSTHLRDGPDDDVCEVYGGNEDDNAVREANARLIASAPSLLAALEDICEAYGCECIDPKHPNHCPMCLGRAAIAQATGEK